MTTTRTDNEFQIRGLEVRYGADRVVRDMNLSAAPGRVTCVLGPNGAGKTTTLRASLGLVRRHAGECQRPDRTNVLLDDGGLIPGLTVRQHVTARALSAGVPTGCVDDLIDTVEMSGAAAMKIGRCSMGMKRRTALAAALVGDPQLVVLDEPSAGLDPEGIRWLGTLLRGLARQGVAVLTTTHHLAEAAAMTDDVAVIAGGTLRFSGPLEEMTSGTTTGSLDDAFFALTGGEAR
ncbi:ABC transporter ATP-binding protein [Corynebacterium antarcticum]|uniref:ABC transporter ATP-binding protein n=1 Tax=Corynebacterium antarcticum TaxID=2800405 RepID=UPI002260B5EC|nr:ATP-binding cassette domain-containing protein [Corynebacterium antarcticum]MCX7539808.1 ATP-binding cassette domain-containing protein [Corynebacterium antarcticum]